MAIPRHALLVALVTLPLLACGRESAHPEKAVEPPVVRDVTISAVAETALEETAEVTGTVKSRTTTTLSSKIVGRIIALHAREGSEVQAGQILIELDDQDIAAQTRRAEAGLREAEAAMEEVDRGIAAAAAGQAAAEAQRDLAASTLARYQRLLDRKSVAPQEYDQVAAQQKVLDPTAIDAAARALLDDPALPMATPSLPLRRVDEMLASSVVKVLVDARGDALYFSRSPIPHVRLGASSDPRAAAEAAVAAGLARKHVGLYAYRREALLLFASLAPSPLEQAEGLEQLRALHHDMRIRDVPVEGEGGVAVDTPEDLERVRAHLAEGRTV